MRHVRLVVPITLTFTPLNKDWGLEVDAFGAAAPSAWVPESGRG